MAKKKKKAPNKPSKSTFVIQLVLIIAIEIFFSMTELGQIYLMPGGIPITLTHLLVIVATLFLGWRSGFLTAFIFALLQLLFLDSTYAANYVLQPHLASQILPSLIIQFIPKLILPLAITFVFDFLSGKIGKKTAGAISAFLGTAVYYCLTLLFIFLFYRDYSIISMGWVNAFIEVAFGTIVGALAVSKVGLTDRKKIDWKWIFKRRSMDQKKLKK